MATLFRAHKTVGTKIPSYFIESTAPNNVDDKPAPEPRLPPQLIAIEAEKAIDEIAAHLAAADHPNLVVMVHGFNNPEPAVLKGYAAASHAIENDPAIANRSGLVCIGYRWPSEKMGQPYRGTWDALPTLPTWILRLGVALLVIFPIFYYGFGIQGWSFPGHVLMIYGSIFALLIATAALLRLIVYFRDNYRATNYGVPDLIEVIRQIDARILQIDRKNGGSETAAKQRRGTQPVELSFIGHSMGGFVVTNAIRVLSDLFADVHSRRRLNAGVVNEATEGAVPPASARIGNVFKLMRFVLASPDIPAETLLSNRANFLASSLQRFREAYLFSNEGDEVLRQISTLANYFIFPTKSWKYGFRLGNVEILSSGYGCVAVERENFLQTLRVGYYTLAQLYETLRRSREEHPGQQAARGGGPEQHSRSVQNLLPEVFTYFDCTDYVDTPLAGGGPTALLTFALRRKSRDPAARMRWWDHVHLLWSYVVAQRPNVHGGYFEGKLCAELMYRLACIGFDDTLRAYGGEGPLCEQCEGKQIRVLWSPRLLRKPFPDPSPEPPP